MHLPTAVDHVRDADVLRRACDTIGAETVYRLALDADPGDVDAWADFGCLRMDEKRFAEAAESFGRVLGSPASEFNHAVSAEEAARLLAEIANARPAWVRGQFSLACVYEHLRDYPRAREHIANTLRLDASMTAALECLSACMLASEENWADAILAADRSIAADPEYFFAHVIRSRALAAVNRVAEACESCRRAIAIQPHPEPHSSLLFKLNFLAETTPEAIYAEARRWNSLYAAPLSKNIPPYANTPDLARRLKVGYVSPDLYNHAIMKFLPPVLEHHDTSRFEVFVYSTGSISDVLTAQVERTIAHFVSIPGSEVKLAERVRADGIDILVDLAGHTMGPALLAFARKPAPVQVSWVGALSTTGMPAINYLIGDAEMPCPRTEHLFTETVYRLPGSFCCYRPFANVPVAAAPCLERGYITFGSFNNPWKITREVAKLWSAILHLAPTSRLLLKYLGLEKPAMHDDLARWFVEDGIARERIQFEGSAPPAEYLASYGKVDIALDPFPYNGGSTTLDALWMGVPLLTLAGRLAVQRTGASVLAAAGLADFTTQTPEQYLQTALYLAEIVPKTPDLRLEIRHALASSPLMDEVGFTRSLEEAYHDMWRTWCLTRR